MASSRKHGRRKADPERSDAPTPERARRRRQFGAALEKALSVRRKTQVHLADSLGTTQSSVSAWKAGQAVPDPEIVFQVERELSLPPGHLSQHLGYVPTDNTRVPQPLEDAIMAEPTLDARGKSLMLSLFEGLTQEEPGKAGRKPALR